MNDQPGYNQPGSSTPLGGSTFPPIQPSGIPTAVGGPVPPPTRRRRSGWWGWCLGCCGGCGALMLVAAIVGWIWFQNVISSVGPIDQATIGKAIGSDVPQYPNSTLDETTTRITAITLKILGNVGGEKIQGALRGIGAWRTADTAEKVLQFYDARMKKLGWTIAEKGANVRADQHMYRKGSEVVVVQAQDQPNGTVIILFRGGPGLAGAMRGNAPTGAPREKTVPEDAPAQKGE